MNFRAFDVLFAVVVILAVVAAVSSLYLGDPYAAVVVAAFAGGASAFLYLTMRVKIAGILNVVDKRLADNEASLEQHRDAVQGSLRALENYATESNRRLADHVEKIAADLSALRESSGASLAEYNANVERAVQSSLAVRQALDAVTAEMGRRLAANEKTTQETATDIHRFTQDFNAFVADELAFRKKIEDHLADRVAYLEDFIREKRKSLQI